MKKIMAGVAALMLVLFVGTTGAHAAGSVQGRNFAHDVGCGRGGVLCRYVDADSNGICDHYAVQTASVDNTVQSQKAYTNYGGHHAGQGHGCNRTGRGNGCGGTCWR